MLCKFGISDTASQNLCSISILNNRSSSVESQHEKEKLMDLGFTFHNLVPEFRMQEEVCPV